MPDLHSVPAGLTFRPPRLPDDLAGMAAAMTAAAPRFPVTLELVMDWHRTNDPALQLAVRVAELEGEVIGVGRTVQQGATEQRELYWINMWVAEPWQRRGVGRALLAELEGAARWLGGRRVRVQVRQDVPGALALADAGGYRRTWTRYESALKVTPELDFSGFDPLLGRLKAEGIVLRSVAELADDPERNRRLWDLDWQLLADVPLGMTLTRHPLDVWVRQDIENSSFCPELSFVALDPALQNSDSDGPLTGPYVGMSSLNVQPGGFYTIGMTGTLPAYRGRGIAKALKVRAMRALQEHTRQSGASATIRTFNDPPNVAMLGMNAALGFVRGPDIYRYERDLDLNPAPDLDPAQENA
ncbi:GNAT family N-acetyltransferase [Deinococcus altitudinis]|uniref:GNAT family N-acetyltransferase n=1 Tax=Deinococcus altitudinis TaxID=468914 RepID=UPI003892AB00